MQFYAALGHAGIRMNDIGQFGSHLFPPGVGNYNMNVRAYDPVHAAIEENIYDISFGHSRRL